MATETEPSRVNKANPEESNIDLNPKLLEFISFSPENPSYKAIAIVFHPLDELALFVIVSFK